MSKILKTSLDENTYNIASLDGCFCSNDLSYIKSLPDSIGEDAIYDEREKIEKCASTHNVYYYNSNWDRDAVSQLEEYAGICNCKIAGVDPKDNSFLQKVSYAKQVEKMASSETTETPDIKNPLMGLMDPFKLDGDNQKSGAKDKEWEKVSSATKLSQPNVLTNLHSVTSIGGGENYQLNNHMNIRRGQNSIVDPDAIQKAIQDKTEDAGQKMRNEKKELETKRKAEIVSSEKKLVADAKSMGFGSMPAGKVQLTGASFAQPGLKSDDLFRFEMPSKTLGEELSAQNQTRKSSIQRKDVEDDREWDTPRSQKVFTVGSLVDVDVLKKNLKTDSKRG